MIKVLINILFTGVSASLYFTHFLSYLLAESQSHELYTNTDLLMRFNVLLLKMFSSWVEMSTAVEPEPPRFSNFCRQTIYLRFFQNNSLVIANYCDSSVLNKSISCLSLPVSSKVKWFFHFYWTSFCKDMLLLYDWCTCGRKSSNKNIFSLKMKRYQRSSKRCRCGHVRVTAGVRCLHSVNYDFLLAFNRDLATKMLF